MVILYLGRFLYHYPYPMAVLKFFILAHSNRRVIPLGQIHERRKSDDAYK